MTFVWQPAHLYAVCQIGAEAALKRDVTARMPGVRPGFARPGFVTFALSQPCEDPDRFQWHAPLARAGGFSLGQAKGDAKGDNDAQCAAAAWSHANVVEFLASRRLRDVHVWPRDVHAPSDAQFHPGPNDASRAATSALLAATPANVEVNAFRPDSRGAWTLDVIVLDPHHWWIGCHRKTSRVDCWPGGVPAVEMPDYALSRAYLKMAEALAWSSLPMTKGDRVVELGCAPGGSSQALLDAGLNVVGVDPAEISEPLASHPRFVHIRRRTKQLAKAGLEQVQWLCADMNVAPPVTLDAVEDIVRHKAPAVLGMLLTLKLPDANTLDQLPQYVERIQSWGFRDVRVRQLAFNRQEICLAVLKSRGQRRMMRQRGRRMRVDAAHGPPGPFAGLA